MKLIILSIFICMPLFVEGQYKIITLNDEPIDFAPRDFYIKDVLDGRENTRNIGIVKVGMFNKRQEARLDGGVEKGIFQYLETSFQEDTGSTPVVMRIVHLRVSEKMALTSEIGKIDLEVEFLQWQNENLEKVFETTVNIEEPTFDATSTHEKRLRQAIVRSLKEFARYDKTEHSVTYFEDTDEVLVKEKPDVVYGEPRSEVKKLTNSLLTFSGAGGLNATGWSLSFATYVNSASRWIIPWGVSMERYTMRTEYFSKFNYYSAKMNYLMPGISAFRKLNDYLYLNVSFYVPLGTEKLTDFSNNTSTKFIVGMAPSQGIHFISKANAGITFGIGIYERVLSAGTYSSDIGIKADFGLKF